VFATRPLSATLLAMALAVLAGPLVWRWSGKMKTPGVKS
jgi:hypothetical protein